MIRFLFIVFMFASVISAVSCSDQKTPEPAKADSCLTAGQIVSYSIDIVPILNTYCTDPAFGSCHQSNSDPNASGFDYTTYDGFASEAPGNIETFVTGPNATMPKSITLGPKTLPDCEKLKIQTWVDQGFPDN
jgi:hypothetical protein